jgi:hypothetical protein
LPATHRTVIVLAVAATLLVAAAPAEATFPGANGKIAGTVLFVDDTGHTESSPITMNPDGSDYRFVSYGDQLPAWSPDSSKIAFVTVRDGNGEIYVMNPDGTGQTRLTNNPAHDVSPAWSPDGTKIAFVSGRDGNSEIYVMNADGTGQTRLTNNPMGDSDPDWSPDGTKIAFTTNRDGNNEIYSMNANGTGATNLTNDPGYQVAPSWSPDGSKIVYMQRQYAGGAFGQIHIMNRDGSAQTQITNGDPVYATPAWSPDGTKIAVFWADPISNDSFIAVMNADGTGLIPVHDATADSVGYPLDWGPVVSGYARPRGASPSEIFLVPAYAQCTGSANRVHGSPLAFPSCAPPSQTSSQLTVGTPDANRQPAKAFAKIVYAARPGDLALTATISDVRNKSGLSDYTGELSLVSDVRITDKDNTPNPGGPGPGTVQDTPFAVTISCSPTPDTTVGSSCNISTTVNALYPGTITAGQRSIWQLGQVAAYDGGSDGDAGTTADNTLFMDEGLFVP